MHGAQSACFCEENALRGRSVLRSGAVRHKTAELGALRHLDTRGAVKYGSRDFFSERKPLTYGGSGQQNVRKTVYDGRWDTG